MDYAFQYIQDAGGIETEAKYPYQAADQKCVADKAKFEAVKVTGWTDVKKDDCDDLQTALAKQPVSVAIAANAIQFYTKGVFSSKFCGTGLNHGVTAVRYGHDATLKKDFWIVRNSWGGVWVKPDTSEWTDKYRWVPESVVSVWLPATQRSHLLK